MTKMTVTTTLAVVLAMPLSTSLSAREGTETGQLRPWAARHIDTDWAGKSELWIDPMGNDAEVSDATLNVRAEAIVYTWLYRGAEQTGELRWGDETLHWKDSWHQPEGVALTAVAGHGSLVAAEYSYAAGAGPDWHWRIKLAERPDGTLVLQMTNIAPWGEEARAVRTVVRKSS